MRHLITLDGLITQAPLGSGSCVANAVTINDAVVCQITTEELTTVAGFAVNITLTSNMITGSSLLFSSSITGGTNTQGNPIIGKIVPASGSAVITIWNIGAQGNSKALNGSLVFSILIF